MVPEGTLVGPGPDAGGSGSRSSGAGLGPPPARAPGRPRALLPFASLGALAERLLPRGAPPGVPPGDRRGVRGTLGTVRSAWGVRHGPGAGLRDGKGGARRMSGIGALLNPRGSGNRLWSLRGQRTRCTSGAGAAPGSLACFRGRGWTRGVGGLLLTGVVHGDPPVCTPLPLWALYLLPPPHGEKSVGGEEGARPGLAARDPLEEVSGGCKFVSGSRGRKGRSGWSSPPGGCPGGE